jgi:hypothetical protein
MEKAHDIQRMQANQQLYQMCREMDSDGNEELTFDELKKGYGENEEFRETLLKMEIGEEDLDIVWAILDEDKSGTVTAKEFADSVYKMRSSESQFMLAYIKYYMTGLGDQVTTGQQNLRTNLSAGQTELKASLKAGQDKLRADLKAGQQELSRKIRAGQQQLKVELQTTICNTMSGTVTDGSAWLGEAATKLDEVILDAAVPENKEVFDLDVFDDPPSQANIWCEQTPLLKDAEEEMFSQLRVAWQEFHVSIEEICRRQADFPKIVTRDQSLMAVIQRLNELPQINPSKNPQCVAKI